MSDRKDANGFSLIEVMVVVAIIALISAVALPSIRNFFKVSINSATREIGAILKQAYNATVISGRVHRIAYDLEKHEFWVEAGPASVLLHTEKTFEEERHRKKFASTEDNEQAEAEARAGFSQAISVTPKKKVLPRGVRFLDVRT
ncbi:MAG: prepilin-type N-terminal cleavage/methylation domain-containing protein, partial [Bdellovibrionota bacterium]